MTTSEKLASLKIRPQWLTAVDLSEHEDKLFLLLSLVVSALIGLVVVAFVVMTERLGGLLVSAGPLQRLISPVVGSLVGGWLLYRFFPSARGSGIPQTRVAIILQNGVIGIRTVIGKFVCSSMSLGSGVALGREGPSVHIGAGIASILGRRLGLSDENIKSLIPVGTAAAVAAAFNTPLAAVLFTLEEILADLHARVVGAVVMGAATSWIVLRLILGDEPLFHVPAYQLVHPVEFLIYAFLGLSGGLISTVFVKLTLSLRAMFLKTPEFWKPFAPAAGGLTVGLLALIAPGVLGVGYNLVSAAVNGQMALKMMLLLLALKIVATASCYGSGNAGGIFGPSLFIGAMLGGAVGQVAHSLLPDWTGNAGAYALVGMGAAFAGIIRTPMTSVIMIFEVTRDYTIIVPLMIANLCSYLLAQRLQKLPIYEALSRQDGIVMPSAAHTPDPLLVESAMRPLPADATPPLQTDASLAPPSNALLVHPDDTLDSAMQRMGAAGLYELPVISRVGARQIGSLRLDDIPDVYKSFAAKRAASADEADRNWLPVVAFITLATVLIVSGLVFWQRSRGAERAIGAHREGQALLSQGRADEAVLAFRNALAQTPQDLQLRASLGLALLQTGHLNEASSYLEPVAKAQPWNGQVWAGLARIALSGAGDKNQARQYYRQALAKDWPPSLEQEQINAQFEYAALVADAGRKSEAFSLLLSLIERHGDDPAVGKRAADLLLTFGSPEQIEQACVLLTSHFPADSSAWMRLGDARFSADKDRLALDAYRNAVRADPGSKDAQAALARVQEVLALDPTGRGLPVRERARRWDAILERVLTTSAACGDKGGQTAEVARAQALRKKQPLTIDASDSRMEAALAIWQSAPDACKTDPLLRHIFGKLKD